jgi:hypothetical protein
MEENEEHKSFLIKSAARENLILKLKRKKMGDLQGRRTQSEEYLMKIF